MNPNARPLAGAAFVEKEAVNDFLWKVYRWMSLGLAATGLVAMAVASTPDLIGLIIANRALFFGLVLGELAMVFYFSARAHALSFAAAAGVFLAYAALNGVTFSVILVAYTGASIARTFFVTAGSFAVLSLFGAATKTDLSPMGRFLFFGVVGLVITGIVNIFLGSSLVYWIQGVAGVLIFAGLTAYDTQKLTRLFAAGGEKGNLAIRGALHLYLDFINLFLFLLRFMGNRR